MNAEGGTVRKIHVEDTGIGVPPDRLDAIFMAFEQGDGAKTRAQQGSGLGLAISVALCEMMDMELSVERRRINRTTAMCPPPCGA